MLTVERVSVELGKRKVLDEIDLEVGSGDIVAILGPSGSGKTTLLRSIVGLQRIDAGDISWEGTSIVEVPIEQRNFALMFQSAALFPHMTVAQNIEFGLKTRELGRSTRTSRVSEMLTLVRLVGFDTRRIETLSGGEQQRVALARALAPRPRLLLLDEPFGSLNKDLRMSLVNEVRQLIKDLKLSAMLVTHDETEAAAFADRIVRPWS